MQVSSLITSDLSLRTRHSTPSINLGVSSCSSQLCLILTLNAGLGGKTSKRVSDHILTDVEAENFTIEKVFLGTPKWIDFEYQV